MKHIEIRKSNLIFIFVALFSLFGISPVVAQSQISPQAGEISSLGPKSLEFELPAGVNADSIKVEITASNNKKIPIRKIDIVDSTYKIYTPMLPPGRVNWSWEYEKNGELVKQNSWFVVDVDWLLDVSTASEVNSVAGLGKNTNKLIFVAVIAFVLGFVFIRLIRRKSMVGKSSMLSIMALVLLLNISPLPHSDTAIAAEDISSSSTSPKTPMACRESTPEIGLARCLRLWSLQAASEDPIAAVKLLAQYGEKYKDDRNGMCEILDEYLYTAIAFIKGNEMAFSLVGKKACGYEGPDVRGIYIASASFIENDTFEEVVQEITTMCASVVSNSKPVGTTSCSYPLPWITIRYTNGDLPLAINLCQEQDVFTPYSRCVFWSIGVFVRLISAYTYNGGTLIAERFSPSIDPDNKMIFCQELENDIQGLCFAQASNSTGHTLQDLINYQQDICFKVKADSVANCFAGVGYHLGNFTEISYKDSIKVCTMQPKQWQRGCFLWSIAGRSAHHGARVLELIEDVPLEYRKNLENEITLIRKNI